MNPQQTVYTTYAGHAFHLASSCRALQRGQDLWDYDCDEYCRHRHPVQHAIRRTTIPDAMGDGKLPCGFCMPRLAAAIFTSSCEEDFGHEPVDEYEGTEYAANGVSHIVCARCMTWTSWRNVKLMCGVRTPWPCTSAIVLGLVPRDKNGPSQEKGAVD